MKFPLSTTGTNYLFFNDFTLFGGGAGGRKIGFRFQVQGFRLKQSGYRA
jgi:hypothetical protein